MSAHKIPHDCYWKPHNEAGQSYDLTHLHPFDLDIVQPASGDKPANTYQSEVIFSIHCFTRNKKDGERVGLDRMYSDTRESRVFCPDRYELSRLLPDFVRNIDKGLDTGKGNFLTFKAMNSSGVAIEYTVFFTLSRSSKIKGTLNFYINSAYPQDPGLRKKRLKPMKLHIIAKRVLHKKL